MRDEKKRKGREKFYKLTLHCKFGPSKPKKGLIHQNLEESAKKKS